MKWEGVFYRVAVGDRDRDRGFVALLIDEDTSGTKFRILSASLVGII